MCGIIGYIGYLHPTQTKEVFSYAFDELKSRGTDASGLAAIYEDNSFDIIKHCIPSNELITLPEYNEILNNKPKIVIAHTRAKTHGTNLQNKNNHPFYSEDGEWIVVHNGVINSYYPEVKTDLKSECDSEKILRLIELRGIKTAAEDLDETANSYSVLAINTKKKRLYHFKNSGRNCIIRRAFINNKPSIYFCSTSSIADKGYTRIGINSVPYSHYVDTDADFLYTFDYNGYELNKEPIHRTKNKSWNESRWNENKKLYYFNDY